MTIDELRELFSQMPPPKPGNNILKKQYDMDFGPRVGSDGKVLEPARTDTRELTCEWDKAQGKWVELTDEVISTVYK